MFSALNKKAIVDSGLNYILPVKNELAGGGHRVEKNNTKNEYEHRHVENQPPLPAE